jgi:hypothetical protein
MDLNMSSMGTGTDRGEEGRTTRAIEKHTSRAPSGAYLTLAIGSMVASAALMLSDQMGTRRRFMGGMVSGGRRSGLANFIGQWAPTLLIMGLYNKVVKLERELTGSP